MGALTRPSSAGAIYRARDLTTSKECVVEVLAGLRAKSHEALRLFASAVAHAGVVVHPGIVVTLDCGLTQDGQPFVVEELEHGLTLTPHVAHSPLPIADAVDVVGQVLAALDAAHSKGIAHLDLGTEQVLLETQPGKASRVKVRGLAIVSALLAAHRAGAIDWVAPPQWTSTRFFSPERVAQGQNALDPQADLWALGVMAYALLSGAYPFEGPTQEALLAQIVGHWPAPPSARSPRVPTELDPVLFRALHKNVAARFPNAAEFRKAVLGAWAAHRVSGLGAVAQRARDLTGHGHTSHTSHTSHTVTLTAPTLQMRTQRPPAIPDLGSGEMYVNLPIYRTSQAGEEVTPTSQRLRPIEPPKAPIK